MNAVRRINLIDNRATLATVSNRLVRTVLAEESEFADALIAVLLDRRFDWPRDEWNCALAELAESSLTVSEFLAAEHARTA